MGIKKLFTFIDNNNLYKTYSYLNDLIDDLNIDKKKLLVGVDGNLFCYKYTHSYDNMLIGFFNQILKFLSNKIIPIYIFDGGTILEKENTNILRNQKKIISKIKLEQVEKLLENNSEDKNLIILKKKLEKNSIKINSQNIAVLLELFELLNIPYIFSHGEGEYLAVMLNKYNIIDMFLTDDTDPIPAGINRLIKFHDNSVYYLEIPKLLASLKLTQEQLCDFCILLGSDYAVFNHGLKPNEIYELIIEFKTIDNIYANNKIHCLNEESFEIINKIRNIYKKSPDYEREMFFKNYENSKKSNISIFIDYDNINNYSNIMLEFWDDFLKIFENILIDNQNTQIILLSNEFKLKLNSYISKSKFNVKKIIKFIKNNINDITDEEITNMIVSFDFLNTFGI
jgi:hypothetical protein